MKYFSRANTSMQLYKLAYKAQLQDIYELHSKIFAYTSIWQLCAVTCNLIQWVYVSEQSSSYNQSTEL